MRWEYQHSYLPDQDYAGARDFPTVFPAKHVDTLDVQTFNRVVPRVGVAYDLGGKSVVKATWGLYNYILGDTYADVFAATATANAVFLWHDLNNDKLWTPNETNLEPCGRQPGFRQHHGGLQLRAQPGAETTQTRGRAR